MYKRILSAVNEFINSEMASRYAITLAKACNAKITLIYVAERESSRAAFKRAEDAVERLFLEGKDLGLEIESITEKGEPVKKIREIVKRENSDLVIAATRREDIQKRLFVKTVPKNLMLSLSCSVAIVRVIHMGRAHPKEILVPLRGGMKNIEETGYFVTRLAESFDSKVIVFHSPMPMTSFFRGEVHLKPVEWEERLPKDIEHFVSYLKKYEIRHEKRVRPGIAGDMITIEAASRRNDLIVMGASERSLINSIIKGSPVERVLRETPCDLIILKPRHED